MNKHELQTLLETLLEQGKLEDAHAALSAYEGDKDKDPDILSMRAVLSIAEGKYYDAQALLEKSIALYPKHFDSWFNLGFLATQTQNNRYREYDCFLQAKKCATSDDERRDAEEMLQKYMTEQKKFRVLSGTYEIANQMNTITQALKQNGWQAETVCYYPNYLKFHSDHVLDLAQFPTPQEKQQHAVATAEKLIPNYDVFHFHFGTTLTLDYSDLPKLRELGKKVVNHYWGSEIRLLSKAQRMNNPYAKVKVDNEDSIKRALEFRSRFVSHCVSPDWELYEYVRDYYPNIYFIQAAVDMERYPEAPMQTNSNRPFLIVHAPTAPEIKGTKYIVDAIQSLSTSYNIEFKFIQGMAHEEAKQWYSKADLIVDELHCGTYGLLTIESMCMGKPVITWVTDYMRSKYPYGLPVISANPDTIKEKIKWALDNRDALPQIGKNGREYVARNHDITMVVQKIMDMYQHL